MSYLPAVALFLPTLAFAEATLGPGGFVVRHEMSVAAPAARVYDALVREVANWWSPSHTFTGDAKNLSIEARPGGCFCEKYPDGGGIEHAQRLKLFVETGKPAVQ